MSSPMTDLSAGLHRGIKPVSVDRSSVGDPVAEGISRRVSPSAVAALVDRTTRVRHLGPVDPPPVPVLSVDQDALGTQLDGAVAGDRREVERLLASIRPVVVRYCRARVGGGERSVASADDVAQEVCLAVLKALPAYKDQGRPFLAFVYGIAAHKVADAHRAAARNRSESVPEVPDGPDIEIGPEQRALQGELSERMGRLLQVLPDKQREILVLRVVAGLSAEETAEAVGSTPGAVRVAQHRALTRLRKALDEGC